MVSTTTRPDLDLLLREVVDPEIPTLTIADLGVLRDASWVGEEAVVTITPTYSGCPAMDLIQSEIYRVLDQAGVERVSIKMVYSPAWTTDWLTPEGRDSLARAGIAPPADVGSRPECPNCSSGDTSTISEFGSTACKALLVCDSCGEPFGYFKEL